MQLSSFWVGWGVENEIKRSKYKEMMKKRRRCNERTMDVKSRITTYLIHLLFCCCLCSLWSLLHAQFMFTYWLWVFVSVQYLFIIVSVYPMLGFGIELSCCKLYKYNSYCCYFIALPPILWFYLHFIWFWLLFLFQDLVLYV